MCDKFPIGCWEWAVLSRLVRGKGQICIPRGCAPSQTCHLFFRDGLVLRRRHARQPTGGLHNFLSSSDTFSICRPWTGLKRDGYASLCLSVPAVTGSRLTVGLVLHLSHGFESPRSTELEMECRRLAVSREELRVCL